MPLSAPLSGLLQSGAQAATGIIGTMLQNRGNMKLAKYQYNKDLEMWNMNNAYNSPEAQMERLKKAGLNPNLAFGSGSVTGNSSTPSMPKFQAPRLDYSGITSAVPDVINSLSQYQEYQNKKLVSDNLKEQNNALKLQNANRILSNTLFKDTYDARVQTPYQDLWNKQSEGVIKDAKGYRLNSENAVMTRYAKDFEKSILASYQLQAQKAFQTKRMDDLSYRMKQVDTGLKNKGLSWSDSTFLRAIALDAQGFDSMSMMPYILLENFGGAFEKMLPKIGFLKGQFNKNINYTKSYK